MEPHLGMSHFTFWVVKVAQPRHLGARTLMRSKKALILYDNGLFLHRSTGIQEPEAAGKMDRQSYWNAAMLRVRAQVEVQTNHQGLNQRL